MSDTHECPRAAGLHSDVSFGGEAARRWLHGIGWHFEGDTTSLQVFGDHFANDSIIVSRVWVTGGRLIPAENGNAFRSVLIVDGRATLSTDGWNASLNVDDLVLVDAVTPTSLTCHGGVGFMQFSAANGHLIPFRPRISLPMRFSISHNAMMLATMINTILVSQLTIDDSSTPFLARSLENAVAAAISRADSQEAAHFDWASHTDAARALSLIASRHRDPDFTVLDLADAMHVSRRQLVRILTKFGTSPSAAIRAARLASAERIRLDRHSNGYNEDLAREAGFRDLRGLRRAQRIESADKEALTVPAAENA